MDISILILIFSYLLGAIPNGLIFGRIIWHKDLRKLGSKNIGATNAWRVLGKPAGIFIFVLDFMKGSISVWLAETFVDTPTVMVLAGICAILGHTFSVYLKMHGGKGVATGLGVISMMMPKVTLIVFAIWLAIVLITRYVSVGSCIAAAFVPILAYFFDAKIEFVLFGLLAAIFIIYKHKENIYRLRLGKENKI